MKKLILQAALVSVGALSVTASAQTTNPAATPPPSAAPAAAAQAGYPVTVRDDFMEVTVTKRPLRVVANHPISMEMLLALGVQPVGYGVAPEGTQPGAALREIPGYQDLLKAAPAFIGSPPSLETVAALKPDLIVTHILGNADAERQVRSLAPSLIFNYRLGDAWQRAIVPLGKVLGKEAQARQLLANVDRRFVQARRELAPQIRAGKNMVLYTVDDAGLWGLATNFPRARIFEQMGFTVVSPVKETKTISLETILTQKADKAVLFTDQPDSKLAKDALDMMKRNGFKNVYISPVKGLARFSTGPLSDIQIVDTFSKMLRTGKVQP